MKIFSIHDEDIKYKHFEKEGVWEIYIPYERIVDLQSMDSVYMIQILGETKNITFKVSNQRERQELWLRMGGDPKYSKWNCNGYPEKWSDILEHEDAYCIVYDRSTWNTY